MDIVSLVAGIVSIALAFVAIWQAMYFYTQGKATESRVETALAGMKAQVETLQTVNAKITDRLTRFATTIPRNDTAQAAEFFTATLRSLPEIALKLVPPSQATNEATLRNEMTMAYIVLWYYVAHTNVWASFSLPRPEDFNPERPEDAWTKHVVDQSAADFKYMQQLVAQLHPQEIQNPQFHYAHLYNEVTQLQSRIGDTSEHFARRAREYS